MSTSAQRRGIERLVRSNILSLEPYHCAREKVLGGILLDANENPYPRTSLGRPINRYPDPYQRSLRSELSRFLDVETEQVLAGSGSDEVLDWIFKVFCQPGRDRIAILEPTYGMYRVMADIYGVEVYTGLLDENFQFQADSLLESLPQDVKALFLCSPNNPTGNLLDRGQILALLEAWEGLVVVDEAYFEFSEGRSLTSEVSRFSNLIVLRTFSKAFGRAGLRLGYAVACSDIIEFFLKVKTPYNLNALTLSEGELALNQRKESRKEIGAIVRERRRLEQELRRLEGVEKIFPSDANFLLFKVRADAGAICDRLLEQGIVVRDRSNMPGLKGGAIRVSVGTPDENSIFLEHLSRYLEESGNE